VENSVETVNTRTLIIWTITLLTTIKYVLIAMKADNHGEGGIFSLYSSPSTAEVTVTAGVSTPSASSAAPPSIAGTMSHLPQLRTSE